jgi:hypothetical protein
MEAAVCWPALVAAGWVKKRGDMIGDIEDAASGSYSPDAPRTGSRSRELLYRFPVARAL